MPRAPKLITRLRQREAELCDQLMASVERAEAVRIQLVEVRQQIDQYLIEQTKRK